MSGKINVRGCPKLAIRADAVELLAVLDRCEGGALPVSGGVIEQTLWWSNAAAFVAGEESYWAGDK